MNPVIRPRARDDIIRQFRWYLVEQDAPDAAFGFIDAVEASVEQLLLMPNLGAPKEIRNPALKELRFWPVKDAYCTATATLTAFSRKRRQHDCH